MTYMQCKSIKSCGGSFIFRRYFKQGCKSLLSIGGIICNFTPILPYFQVWGDEPRPRFFSGEEIKGRSKKSLHQKWNTFFPEFRWRPKKKEHFFPEFRWRPQKKSSPKMEHFFSSNSSGDLRSDAHQSQIIGGDANEDHTQTIGGNTVKLLGRLYLPIPPGFGTPDFKFTALSLSWQLNDKLCYCI